MVLRSDYVLPQLVLRILDADTSAAAGEAKGCKALPKLMHGSTSMHAVHRWAPSEESFSSLKRAVRSGAQAPAWKVCLKA